MEVCVEGITGHWLGIPERPIPTLHRAGSNKQSPLLERQAAFPLTFV